MLIIQSFSHFNVHCVFIDNKSEAIITARLLTNCLVALIKFQLLASNRMLIGRMREECKLEYKGKSEQLKSV